MFSPIIRIIIAILGVYMAWNFYSNGNMPSTYMALTGVGLVVWGYFKNGTVFLAFQQLKKENYDKAEQLLTKVYKPELLKKSQRGYYHFTKGFIELNKENTDKAFEELKSALNIGLRTQNDTSIVTLHLASIELERKNLNKAREFLNQTKKLDHKTLLNSEIERIEEELNASQ